MSSNSRLISVSLLRPQITATADHPFFSSEKITLKRKHGLSEQINPQLLMMWRKTFFSHVLNSAVKQQTLV